MILFANLSYGDHLKNGSNELPHPRHTTVGNLKVPREYDCALRAFTIEMAAYIAPASSKANWTALTKSAFQMNQCNSTLNIAYQPSISAQPFKTAPEMKNEACQHIVFVHNLKGNDLFDGAFERPLKTIQSARSLTRSLCSVHGTDNTL